MVHPIVELCQRAQTIRFGLYVDRCQHELIAIANASLLAANLINETIFRCPIAHNGC